jgi:hypothetical protein
MKRRNSSEVEMKRRNSSKVEMKRRNSSEVGRHTGLPCLKDSQRIDRTVRRTEHEIVVISYT